MSDFIITQKDWICGICIADGAPETSNTAAGELVRVLVAQSGNVAAIYCGTPKAGDICLGAKSVDCEADELRLEVQDGVLWIDGGKRGIIYGVYELLERLGCRFLAEDCEVLPEAEVLTIPGDMNVCQKPVFEYRCTNWNGVTAKAAPKMRINACLSDRIPECWGGDLHYQGFVHTLGDLSEMEKINGEYTDRQPCLTDEKVFQNVVKNLRAKLQEDPDAAIASVSQNDSHEWGRGCTCEKCRALDEAEGTPMGSLLPFVNRVAEELEDEYPNLAIDTLAYRYTRKAPKTLKARHNVIVRLCSIECCFSHPIAECDASTDKVEDGSFADCLREWANHCDRIYIWDYTTDFQSYHNVFPNFNVLRQNARFFAENNVRGLFEQGDQQTINGEFGPLRAYLLTKLLWDPYMSEETYQQHIDDFMSGYYGAGWKHIRRFFDRMQAAAKDVHFGIYFKDPTVNFVDPEIEGTHEEKAESFLKKGRADFAAALVCADEKQREHICRAEIQLDLYEWYLVNGKRQALSDEDPAKKELEKELYNIGANLYAHVITYGISTMYECWKTPTLLQKTPDFLSEPAEWGLK